MNFPVVCILIIHTGRSIRAMSMTHCISSNPGRFLPTTHKNRNFCFSSIEIAYYNNSSSKTHFHKLYLQLIIQGKARFLSSMYVLKLIAYAYCCLYELSCCLHIDLQPVYLYPGIWIWCNPYPQIKVHPVCMIQLAKTVSSEDWGGTRVPGYQLQIQQIHKKIVYKL